jgi:hypothetical protein
VNPHRFDGEYTIPEPLRQQALKPLSLRYTLAPPDKHRRQLSIDARRSIFFMLLHDFDDLLFILVHFIFLGFSFIFSLFTFSFLVPPLIACA